MNKPTKKLSPKEKKKSLVEDLIKEKKAPKPKIVNIAPKKPKKEKKPTPPELKRVRRPTKKQKKYMKALVEGKSYKEAKEAAGYSPSASNKQIESAASFQELAIDLNNKIEVKGGTNDILAEKLVQALSATKSTIFFGEEIDTTLVDHQTIMKAVEFILKIRATTAKEIPPEVETAKEVTNDDIDEMSSDELNDYLTSLCE